MTRKSPDPFALGKAALAAQQKQLELARQMMAQGEAVARWQEEALAASERMAMAQREWLKLWGW